jgi:hypothetical protein
MLIVSVARRDAWSIDVTRPADYPKALSKKTCKCGVAEISQLEAIRDSAKNPSDYLILPMSASE